MRRRIPRRRHRTSWQLRGPAMPFHSGHRGSRTAQRVARLPRCETALARWSARSRQPQKRANRTTRLPGASTSPLSFRKRPGGASPLGRFLIAQGIWTDSRATKNATVPVYIEPHRALWRCAGRSGLRWRPRSACSWRRPPSRPTSAGCRPSPPSARSSPRLSWRSSQTPAGSRTPNTRRAMRGWSRPPITRGSARRTGRIRCYRLKQGVARP